MRAAWMLVLSGLLTGCLGADWLENAQETTTHESWVIGRTGYLWSVEGLPVGWITRTWQYGFCRHTLQKVKILRAAVEDLTHYCQPDTDAGCYHAKGWDGGVIVASRALEGQAYDTLLVHEALHHMAACAFGTYDGDHTIPIVWDKIQSDVRCDLLLTWCPDYIFPELRGGRPQQFDWEDH